MKRHFSSVLIAVVLIITGMHAWASGSPEDTLIPEQTVTIALGGDPSTLDPHRSFNGFVFTVTNQIYETLIHRAPGGELVPELATDWRSIDDTTWEFDLREGVVFHDGTPFDAQSVQFSIERLLAPETRAIGSFILTMVEEVRVVDEYTVRIVTDRPFAPLPAHLSHPVTAIVSPIAAGGDLGVDPVGTGPFVFESRSSNTDLRLQVNTDYWGGEPSIQRIVFQVVPEAGTQIVALQAGTIDLITDVPPERFESIETDPALSAEQFLGWGSVYLGYNTARGPLADERVRRAIALAIDRRGIIDNLREGMALPAIGMVPDTVFGSETDAAAIPFDPAEARRLLADAGVTPPLSLTLNTFERAETRQLATAIQAQLREIGIELSVEITDYGAFAAATSEPDHGLWLTTWGTVTLDADYTLFALLHSGQRDGDNRSFYADPEVDRMLEEARATADEALRRGLYADIHAAVVRDLPYLTLYYPLSSYAKNDRLVGEEYGFSAISLDLRGARIE